MSSSASTITKSVKRKCPNPTTSYSIPTQNNFEVLSDVMDTHPPENSVSNHNSLTPGIFHLTPKPVNSQNRPRSEKTSTSSKIKIPTTSRTSAAERPKKVRPPPIVAYEFDHKKCTTIFPKIIGDGKYTLTKVNAGCSRIQLDNKEDFVKIKEALTISKTPFHSFTPNDEKPTSIIIRNLCHSFEKEDIFEALNNLNLNINIRSVSKYETEYSKRAGRQLRLWLIQLEPMSDIVSLLKTTYLLHQKVKFERRKQSGTSQCFNCQHFGHSSKNCNRPYRCVKCTDNHKPGECPLPEKREHHKELLPTCVNCGENHAANFRGCKTYLAHIKRNHQKSPAKPPITVQEIRNALPISQRKEGVSYASIVSNNPKTNHNQQPQRPSCLDFLDSECNTHFGVDFNSILTQTTAFMPTYYSLSKEQKPIALLKFVMSIIHSPSP